jgi:hypothetical protein
VRGGRANLDLLPRPQVDSDDTQEPDLSPKGYCADVKSFGSPFPIALVTLESSSDEITFL